MTEQDVIDKTRAIAADVIDTIAEDEEFREAMKANPEGAMEQWGFAARVDELGQEADDDEEVQGFGFGTVSPRISLDRLRTGTIVASSPPSTAPTCGCAAQVRRP